MLGTAPNTRFLEREFAMSRNAKVKIAALATAVLTTVGTASVTAATVTVDAGKSGKIGNSWCC